MPLTIVDTFTSNLTWRVEEEPLLVRTKRSGSKRSAMIEQTEIVGR